MIVVGDHVIDASLRLRCRQRERYGLRPLDPAHGRRARRALVERAAGLAGCVDGPFLEGGDTLLNGREIYVGMSGCASDMAGIDWLQALLGALPRDPGGAALVRPASRLRAGAGQAGLLIWCPENSSTACRVSLRDWDAIAVSRDEASRLGDQRPGAGGRPHDRRRRQPAGHRRIAQGARWT
jgi:N-dimethylarginine dimethylaminohydrolase